MSPLREWGLTSSVAGGPTPHSGGGSMARGVGAAPLRLPLAPNVTGNVPRGSSRPTSPWVGQCPQVGQTGSAAKLGTDGRGVCIAWGQEHAQGC